MFVPCPLFLKFNCPLALEIDRIGEHESRVRLDHSASQKILDLGLRLLLNPLIDAVPGRFRTVDEIELLEVAPII